MVGWLIVAGPLPGLVVSSEYGLVHGREVEEGLFPTGAQRGRLSYGLGRRVARIGAGPGLWAARGIVSFLLQFSYQYHPAAYTPTEPYDMRAAGQSWLVLQNSFLFIFFTIKPEYFNFFLNFFLFPAIVVYKGSGGCCK